ncbi:MAG: LapA family protein [Rhodospirillales bacterium]|jgi:hypothetical protein|nr:LapA family protein [Rhodospirillales bacterium]MDP7651457.1 LapA family protein [Rhodospirillales bacterium]
MRVLVRIILLPVAIVAVGFALANRETVSVGLWPLDYSIETPVFALVLISASAGLVLGGIVSWISAAGPRRRARAVARELVAARSEAGRLRETLKRIEDDVEWREKSAKTVLPAPPSANAA